LRKSIFWYIIIERDQDFFGVKSGKFEFVSWKEAIIVMPQAMRNLIEQYISEIKKIYGSHLQKVILYGSYARGDFRTDSDVDIMILLDLTDSDLKAYSRELSYMTYDFNLDNNLDIKPIAKNEEHFRKWVVNYPFYASINNEGVVLYGAA